MSLTDEFGYNTKSAGLNVDLSAVARGNKPYGTGVFEFLNDQKSGGINRSFMQQLGIARGAPAVKTGDMMRNTTRAATDTAQVRTAAGAAKASALGAKQAMKQDWQVAKGQCMETIAKVAEDMELDPRQALSTFLPSASIAENFLGNMALEIAAKGSGTIASVMRPTGQAMDIAEILGDRRKNLSPDKAKDLINEAQSRLASSEPVSNGNTFSPAKQDAYTPKSSFNWQEFTPDDLKDFLQADFNDQPETRQIDALLADLDKVERNLDVAEVMENDGRGNKVDMALERGDAGALEAMEEILEDCAAQGNQAAAKVVAAPEIDSGDVMLTGAALQGITAMQTAQGASLDENVKDQVRALFADKPAAESIAVDQNVRVQNAPLMMQTA